MLPSLPWPVFPFPFFSSCTKEEAEDFLQKHFKEMTAEEKKQVIAKLEQRYLQKYGKKFQISTQEALPDTLWGYGLDLSRCIGCRRCVYACVKENNNSRDITLNSSGSGSSGSRGEA